MDSSILNELLPTLIFFVLFSALFAILEMVVVIYLDSLEKKYWEYLIDVLIRSEVHHGRVVKYLFLGIIGFLFILFISFTPLINILSSATGSFRIFALLLALLILLFLLINSRRRTKARIEKRIYAIVFLAISLIIYIFVIIIAQKSYVSYAEYVNKKLVDPAVKTVTRVVEAQEKERMLKTAKEMYLSDKCTEVDYTTERKEIIMKNILLLESDPDMAFGSKNVDINDPQRALKGMECNSEKEILLLTENGDWYLVNEEYIHYIK